MNYIYNPKYIKKENDIQIDFQVIILQFNKKEIINISLFINLQDKTIHWYDEKAFTYNTILSIIIFLMPINKQYYLATALLDSCFRGLYKEINTIFINDLFNNYINLIYINKYQYLPQLLYEYIPLISFRMQELTLNLDYHLYQIYNSINLLYIKKQLNSNIYKNYIYGTLNYIDYHYYKYNRPQLKIKSYIKKSIKKQLYDKIENYNFLLYDFMLYMQKYKNQDCLYGNFYENKKGYYSKY